MRPLHWFTPQTLDLLGMLDAQATVTLEGIESLVAWSQGDADAARRLLDAETRADEHKRQLRAALSQAFVTPLEPEDIFELSRLLDQVVTSAKNTVGEAELMHASPDEAMAMMASELVAGTRQLASAFHALACSDHAVATGAADAAVASERAVKRAYRTAMSALVDVPDLREVASKRELYRRLARTGDHLVDTAERVWYAVLKRR
jgi:uncharacterized protein Yka (UPF0111/DUF47 family)